MSKNRQATVHEMPSGKYSVRIYHSVNTGRNYRAYKAFTVANFKEAIEKVTAAAAERGHDYDVTLYAFQATAPITIFAPEDSQHG